VEANNHPVRNGGRPARSVMHCGLQGFNPAGEIVINARQQRAGDFS
jgi:hypothetical protein